MNRSSERSGLVVIFVRHFDSSALVATQPAYSLTKQLSSSTLCIIAMEAQDEHENDNAMEESTHNSDDAMDQDEKAEDEQEEEDEEEEGGEIREPIVDGRNVCTSNWSI